MTLVRIRAIVKKYRSAMRLYASRVCSCSTTDPRPAIWRANPVRHAREQNR